MTILSTALTPNDIKTRKNIIRDTAKDLMEWTYPVFTRVQVQEFVIVDRTAKYLKKPVRVLVEQTQSGNWAAYHPVILTHGYGKNEIEAAQDFHNMMIDLYVELRDSEDQLAPHLRREFDYLREFIVENSVA